MRAQRVHLILVAILLGTPAVWAALRHQRASQVASLLEIAARAHEQTSYAGTILWNGRHRGKPIRVRHDAGSGRTSYEFSHGRGRGRTKEFRTREFVVSRPSSRMPDPSAWCLDPEGLRANYRAVERARQVYLDRPVRVLRARPVHAGRPSLEVWMDEVSGLPLKVVSFRDDGSLYRVSKFESIEFGPQEVREIDLHKAHRYLGTPTDLSDPQGAAGFRPLMPDYLPAGFRRTEARVKQGATPRLTMLFTDGATAFEIRQSPKVTPAAMEEHYRRTMGERGARRMTGYYLRKARDRLVRSGFDGAATTVRRSRGTHNTWELRVGDLDVRLSARQDLGTEQVLDVLRSLRFFGR